MKRLAVLLILVAALAAVAYTLYQQRGQNLSGGQSGASREVVFPDLPVNDVERVILRDFEDSVTLVRGEERWQVAERDGYPASIDKVRQLVLDVEDLKVSGRQQVGATALAETGLLRPDEAKNEDEAGLQVQLQAGSEPVADFVLGVMVRSSGAARSPMSPGSSQRMLRTAAEGDTAWLVSTTFANASASPADWLDREFFSVSMPKSIEVTRPDADQSWKAWRGTEEEEFIRLGDERDTVLEESRSSLRFLLTSPSFLDVIAPDQAEPDLMAGASRAVIETFDGFTYTIDFVERKPATDEDAAADEDADAEGAEAADEAAEQESRYYMMIDVQAEFPAERQERLEEEDEQFAAAADDVFRMQQDQLREKLEQEQRFNGWIYEVSEFTLATINRDRDEMLGEPLAEEDPEEAPDPVSGVPEVQELFEQLERETRQPEAGTEPIAGDEPSEPAEMQPEPSGDEPSEPVEIEPEPSGDEPSEPTETDPEPSGDEPSEPAETETEPSDDEPAAPAEPEAEQPGGEPTEPEPAEESPDEQPVEDETVVTGEEQ